MRDVVEQVNERTGGTWDLLGFLDDDTSLDDVVGPLSLLHEGVADAYVSSFADPDLRERWDVESAAIASVSHPSAVMARDFASGPGLVVRGNATIGPGVVVGRHVYLSMNCSIGHDVSMADYVTIHPGANIGGGVALGQGSTVATGAVVLPQLRIGAGAYVGAGAVVTKNVPPGVTVVGNPARKL